MSQDGVYILEFHMPIYSYVALNVCKTVDGKNDTITRKGAVISAGDDMARVDRVRV